MDPTTINGRYQVLERIGKGAMGIVYKAHDPVLERVVAVKRMVAEIEDDPDLRRRFSQEARAAARLNHRNIVTIYELEQSDHDLCIVMELLEGVDLATLIRRKVALPLDVTLNVMGQVCEGLDFAHRKGLVHRDIKPANLHISPAGVVKILDFGIARLASSKMTSTGGLIGTPDYMSPEQAMAAPVDARSDLFAVGAVLYELIGGVRPFEAESVTAVLMRIVREPHVPLRIRAPHVPRPLTDLVERLLAKQPEDRPQTAEEVRAALQSVTASESASFDGATIAILSRVVATETVRPRTPLPAVSTSAPGLAALGASSEGEARMTSLVIARGRTMRESGDLAGAINVFRSVLEIAPGNADALLELRELENAISRITASNASVHTALPNMAARAASPSDAAIVNVGAAAVIDAVPHGNRVRSTRTIAGACLLTFIAGGTYLAFRLGASRTSEPPSVSSDGVSTTSATTTSVPPIVISLPPATPPSGAPSTTSAKQVSGPRTSSPPVPPAPETTTSVSGPATPAPPVVGLPLGGAVIVQHRHKKGILDWGRKNDKEIGINLRSGFCEGTLTFLPDGVHFKTTAAGEDKRVDDERFLFSNIKEFEIDDDGLLSIKARRNWHFRAPPEVLTRVLDYLRRGRPTR